MGYRSQSFFDAKHVIGGAHHARQTANGFEGYLGGVTVRARVVHARNDPVGERPRLCQYWAHIEQIVVVEVMFVETAKLWMLSPK